MGDFEPGAGGRKNDLPRPPIHVLAGWFEEVPCPEERQHFPTSVKDPYGWNMFVVTEFKGEQFSVTLPTFGHLAGNEPGLRRSVANQLWFKYASHVTFEEGWLRKSH